MSDEHWHGTWNGYNNRKCRCDACRGAAREYMRGRQTEYHRERRAKFDGPCLTPGCPRKMSKACLTGYCEPCSKARRKAVREDTA